MLDGLNDTWIVELELGPFGINKPSELFISSTPEPSIEIKRLRIELFSPMTLISPTSSSVSVRFLIYKPEFLLELSVAIFCRITSTCPISLLLGTKFIGIAGYERSLSHSTGSFSGS